MKKLSIILSCAIIALSTFAFTGCKDSSKVIKVGATSTPHAEILEIIEDDIKNDGFTLEIVRFNDYMLPNKSLFDGEIDANYFQHQPFLENYNKNNGTDLVAVGKIHYEPMGVFGKNINSFKEVKNGGLVIVPADSSNQARALLLLAKHGVITLKEGLTIKDEISIFDITDKKGLNITPVEAATIPAQLKQSKNGTLAVINGNYALNSDIDLKTAIAIEDKKSESALEYANVIAVKKGNETSEKTKSLLKALSSEKVKNFIEKTYKGSVLPIN